MKRFATIFVFVSIAALVFAMPVFASAGNGTSPAEPTLEQVLLGVVGAAISVAFKIYPPLKSWYEGLPSKGIAMFAIVVAVGILYFGLSCSQFAQSIGISLACTQKSAVDLIMAIFSIAAGNQLAYLYTPNK